MEPNIDFPHNFQTYCQYYQLNYQNQKLKLWVKGFLQLLKFHIFQKIFSRQLI